MPTFVYEGKESPEKTVRGRVEAPDRTQAIVQLRRMGYRLLALEEESRSVLGGTGFSWQALRRIKVSDLAVFWRQLASLLEAGLPLVKALETVEQQTENPKLAGIISEVKDSVQEGASLSTGLSRFPGTFNPLYVSITASGEATGTLPKVAEQLADQVEKEQDLKSKIRSALVYPVFLCVVGAIVVGVLVTFVIPKFTVLFRSLGQELPLPTRILISTSRFAHGYWWALLGGLAVVVFALVKVTRKGAGRRALDHLKLNLPVLGNAIEKIEIARFAHTFGTLCANGVHILPALDITTRTVTNKVIAAEVSEARHKVAKGTRIEAALREGDHFPPALINMVAVGEDSASLDKMLAKIATVYERESDRMVGTVTRLMESVLILILGAVVGLIVAAILLPIFRATAFVG